MTSETHVLHPLFAMAEREPDRVVLTFVDERGRDAEVRTAKRLVEDAQRLAAWLREGCGLQPGDVALLIYPPSMEFAEAFVGCLLAGVIPAPVYPPNPARPEGALPRLCTIAAQSRAKAMLTSRSYRWAVRLGAAKGAVTGNAAKWPELPWYVTHGFTWTASRSFQPPSPGRNDLALLQFTSGSTSQPKGVRLTHSNLIHQLDFNRESLRMGRDARFVMWVPQYHDLGLISGILGVLRGNGALWMMSPQSFLANASLWPETMHRIRATHTSAPNFGYELVTRRTTPEQRARWDLSTVRLVISAAEPIMPRTVDRFFDAFAASRLARDSFCPAYGLAEHTVGVTVCGRERIRIDRQTLTRERLARPDESGDLELIGCGRASHGIEVRIVDPQTRKALEERHVGEIWVQSPSVADGYDQRPEATAATFGATLEGEKGNWLRTGDLGFINRGELYIAGREKDLIIVRGRNMYPEDLEEAVRFCHPDIRAGGIVAFAVPGDATEGLVLVAEVKDPKTADVEGSVKALDKAVLETWQIPATVVLVPPGTVPKTTSGKLRRSDCRQTWLDGKLATLRVEERRPVAPVVNHTGASLRNQLEGVSPDDRLDWLLQVVQQIAASEQILPEAMQIGPDEFLPDIGLDSLGSSQLIAALEKALEHRAPTCLFIEHPTFRSAAGRMLREIGVSFTDTAPPELELSPMPFRPAPRAMAPAQTRIGIVGGGVGGLVSAIELARLGYRHITLFESDSRCGGKVRSTRTGDGALVELGQIATLESCRTVVKLASELGLEFVPHSRNQYHFDDTHGIELAPAVEPGRKWMRSVLNAAKIDDDGLPFPSTFATDETFGEFIARHKLRAPHPWFWLMWAGMGYGLSLDTPASYVLAYLQLVAPGRTSARVKTGNQSLWTALAERLEEAWGVRIHRETPVTGIRPDASGVTIEAGGRAQRFDEVVLATPPNISCRLLPPDDPLQPLLREVTFVKFRSQGFRASGLPKQGMLFALERITEPGRTIIMQGVDDFPGWYACGTFSSTGRVGYDGTGLSDLIPDDVMIRDLRETVATLGGEVLEIGPAENWLYFPHVLKNPADVLRRAEGLQGQRHLWTTGGWLSFETVEHVARHASHLVQTCFDPSGA